MFTVFVCWYVLLFGLICLCMEKKTGGFLSHARTVVNQAFIWYWILSQRLKRWLTYGCKAPELSFPQTKWPKMIRYFKSYLSFCLFLCLCINTCLYLTVAAALSLSVFLCLSVCLIVCLPVWLSLHLSVYLSVSFCITVLLFNFLFPFRPSSFKEALNKQWT